MLVKMLEEGYGKEKDYNCAETIVYGGNIAYNIGIQENDLKLAAAFGGGMGIESSCGVVTGALMILGRLFTDNGVQHQSPKLRVLTNEFIEKYTQAMGSIDCAPLKEAHRTQEVGCKTVIHAGAKILDEIIERERR